MDVSCVQWRKSRRSSESGDNCVELASFPDMIAIRDSKSPDGPQIRLTSTAFRALLRDLKQR
ncbi:DUF397 domain-containing protein [Actinomadura geliboluensis]|uniref:DUF397 domain-containing protein n=1 Tax=Actinomadura geliboluensis TaxID=882440 RepID=UPI00371BE3B8